MAYLRVCWSRRWVVAGVLALFVAGVSAWVLTRPKTYAATTSLIIDLTAPRFLDQQVQDVTETAGAGYWYNKEYYETQQRVITSRAVAQRVVDRLGLHQHAEFLGIARLPEAERAKALAGADAAAVLQGKIRVDEVKDSRLVLITVEDDEPNRAALLANELADAYMAETLALRLRVTDSASKWLEERLADLEARSAKSELAVFDFKKSEDILTTSLEDRASIVSQRLNTYNGALNDVRTRIAALKARVAGIEAQQAAAREDAERWAEAIPGAQSQLIDSLKLRFVNLRTECGELGARYLADHPALVSCNEKLAAAKGDLVRELNNVVRAAQGELREALAQEKNLDALVNQAKAEAFEVNKKQIDFDHLRRQSDNDRRLYDLVLKRLKDIELSGLLRTSNVRVLDAARPNLTPVRPNVKGWILLAAVLGLLAGLALALALESLDTTVSQQADVEQKLGLPFLGLVPAIPPALAAPGTPDLYIHRQPKSSVAESCRAIRTNLLFMSPDKPFKTMLVTSSAPQEGKSATVINLGIAMAQSGSRVVVLDTDMRRPRLHKAFAVSNELGVSSLVVGDGSLEDAVKSTDVPNLFVLPCGPLPPNPAELLHTQAFGELLKKLSAKFDRVILDSPPIGAVADAVVLSTRVDGVVLVLKAGVTYREHARRAARALQDVNARLFGVVLNYVDLADPKYGSYFAGYSRYGYYYGEAKDEAASG